MKTRPVHIDPEFANLIPPASAEEFARLKCNLKAHGCLEPLIVWPQGDYDIILDGHNRKHLCDEYTIPYETQPLDLPDRDAAMLWIIDHQCGRRNLSTSQRLMLAAHRKIVLERAAKKRKGPDVADCDHLRHQLVIAKDRITKLEIANYAHCQRQTAVEKWLAGLPLELHHKLCRDCWYSAGPCFCGVHGAIKNKESRP